MSDLRHATHGEVPPIINDKCTALVLGSMLSPKSSEARFYYAHPQNRFWRVLEGVFDAPHCTTNNERAELALTHGVALWDVLESCDIDGASDSSIKNAQYNDIAGLLAEYPNIKKIFTTGQKAHDLLMRYNKGACNEIIAAATRLPSTSPLNCAAKLDDLITAYSILKTI